jgi:DNA-binding MarR family transcriptional regulator
VGCASGRWMHRVFFSVKRLHWLWQRRAEVMLYERDVWMTPARFTLLRVLHTYRHGLMRAKLAQLLGVAGPGVSRMVKALEAEGLVVRRRSERDKRIVRIELTDGGRDVVECGLGSGNDVMDLDGEVQKTFASSKYPEVDLHVLDRLLIRGRWRLGDRALYPEPWQGGEVFWDEPGVIGEPPPFEVHVAA